MFSVLLIKWLINKILQVHIHPHTSCLTYDFFPLPSHQGRHRFLSCVCTVSCATIPCFRAAFQRQDCDADGSNGTFTAHSTSLPTSPTGGCQLPMIFLKGRGAEQNPALNPIAYGAEKNEGAIVTFIK